jgi:hypothetical protein
MPGISSKKPLTPCAACGRRVRALLRAALEGRPRERPAFSSDPQAVKVCFSLPLRVPQTQAVSSEHSAHSRTSPGKGRFQPQDTEHRADSGKKRIGASRELREESGLIVRRSDVRPVLSFFCNCDPTEPEHEVVVYSVAVPLKELREARGRFEEPVAVWPLPLRNGGLLWYLAPLLALVLGRMRQPVAEPQAMEVFG